MSGENLATIVSSNNRKGSGDATENPDTSNSCASSGGTLTKDSANSSSVTRSGDPVVTVNVSNSYRNSESRGVINFVSNLRTNHTRFLWRQHKQEKYN